MGEEFETNNADKERTLESSEVCSQKNIGDGYNKTCLVELARGETVVFKPKSGEKPAETRKELQAGTYYLRERAAFLVSEALEFNLVPTTVIREVNGEVGSAQEFISDAEPALNYKEAPIDATLNENLKKLWIFDYIIWNSDRTWNNALVKNNEVFAIDNGSCFGKAGPKIMRDFFHQKLPQDVVDNMRQFLENSEKIEQLSAELKNLLSTQDIEACIKRIRFLGKLIKDGKIDWDDRHKMEDFLPK